MIDKINTPQCFKSFYTRNRHPETSNIKEPLPASIKILSAGASLAGAFTAAYLLAKRQGLKGFSGTFKLNYNEPKLIAIGTSALACGYAAGSLYDNKKYFSAKTKEATHQFLANIISPLLTIGILNNLYSKVSDRVKLPQFKNNTGIKKIINNTIKVVPNLAVTLAGLTGGLYIGTKISNLLIGRDGKPDARKVKALDYIYHPDDVATALVLADKNGTIQKIVGKIIPPIFALHGYEAGTKR